MTPLHIVRKQDSRSVERVCEACNQSFQMPANELERRPGKFCSTECKSKGMAGKSLRPVKYTPTEEIDQAIRETYQSSPVNGQVKKLAERIGWPRWKVSGRAVELGVVQAKKKEPIWSEDELNILENNAHLSLPVISRKLKKAGYSRSVNGILLKRKRMRFLSNLKGQSANELAQCFGLDIHVILKWIKDGYLKATKRGTCRTEKQGGDIWFIRHKDVKPFIINNVHLFDIRKVDKYWFVDILTGKEAV